jgi:uncharacterized protein (DUF1919 family)
MRKCVIWNGGDIYEAIINQVKFEELKGNLNCAAILSKSMARFIKKRDGYDVIGKEDLYSLEFDYLIIAAKDYYKEILAEAIAMGIPREKIINCRVLQIPNFDLSRYVSLRENPVTILSDDCWGGYVYHVLDLPFTSPLINIYWPRDSFCEFIQDPFFYLGQPLRMVQEANPRKNMTPICRLGDGEKNVQLNMVHAASFQEAENLWNKRKERINRNRVFIKFGFDGTDPQSEEYLRVFDQLPYDKICTYSGKTKIKNVIYAKRFERDWYHGKRIEFGTYKDWFRQEVNFLKTVDLLKLLNHEHDYIREM